VIIKLSKDKIKGDKTKSFSKLKRIISSANPKNSPKATAKARGRARAISSEKKKSLRAIIKIKIIK